MKVCTDACLFGALVANSNLPKHNCLDIGTGTGLLSLMIAQKNNAANMDAIEIETAAAEQAAKNMAASPWAGNIRVLNVDITSFNPDKKYDTIISNPPFFEDDLKSAVMAKNKAKHESSLSLVQLVQIVNSSLAENGFFTVLLPYHRVSYFIDESKKNGLHLNKQILVKQTIKHKFFRGILFFSRKETKPQLTEMIIKNAENNYTPEFSEALKDYYLFL
jgi:tRNA1Val (adenine37-N6)-methyltransferase